MKNSTHDDIKIHVGTNDCSAKFPADKIASNISAIVTEAKRVSSTGHITFSSITPRVDNLAAAEKSIIVNEKIRDIATSNGCIFVFNQDNFLCKNGDLNEELLSLDGLHLSKLGTERLISNIKLNSLACFRIGRSQRPGGEARHTAPQMLSDEATRHRGKNAGSWCDTQTTPCPLNHSSLMLHSCTIRCSLIVFVRKLLITCIFTSHFSAILMTMYVISWIITWFASSIKTATVIRYPW